MRLAFKRHPRQWAETPGGGAGRTGNGMSEGLSGGSTGTSCAALHQTHGGRSEATAAYEGMTLTIAVAYNGRDEIVDAVRALRTEHAERGLAIAEAIPEITVTTVTERIHPPPQQKFTEIWIGLDRSTAWLPKPVKWREWPRREFARLYFPNAEPREIDNVQVVPRIHQSVIDRMNALADYRPENFPASFDIEPNSSQRRRA